MLTKIRNASINDLETITVLMGAYYRFEGLLFKETVARKALQQLLRDEKLGLVWLVDMEKPSHISPSFLVSVWNLVVVMLWSMKYLS